MKRIQLFEFEDQSWFPDTLRISMTRLIMVLHKLTGLSPIIKKELDDMIEKTGLSTVVDIGSGAGGAMEDVHQLYAKDKTDVKFILTDLYPNQKTIARINTQYDDSLRYYGEPVNAVALENTPEGIKTMLNSFHHLPPHVAKSILKSAKEAKQPIMIYEMADNKIPLLIWWLFLPISLVILIVMVFFMTPFVRPLKAEQLLLTYIIPVIPIFYAWDGQASLPRIYTLEDLDELLDGLQSTDYIWEKGSAINSKGKKQGYYLKGYPAKAL